MKLHVFIFFVFTETTILCCGNTQTHVHVTKCVTDLIMDMGCRYIHDHVSSLDILYLEKVRRFSTTRFAYIIAEQARDSIGISDRAEGVLES